MENARYYFELVGDFLIGPTLLKEGDMPPLKKYEPIPLNLDYIVDETKTNFVISHGMEHKDFAIAWTNFQKITSAQITFDELTIFKDNQVVNAIKGQIRPNRAGQQIHHFEIHDLEKYSLLLSGNSQEIFPPQYIDNNSQKLISANHSDKDAISVFLANNKTTKEDLNNWAKVIQKHGILFNFEESVFDENDRLIGLNGKFNARCCFSDEFYYNVEELEVRLEVKDDYVYQPMVIKNNKSLELKESLSENTTYHLKSSNGQTSSELHDSLKQEILSQNESKSLSENEEIQNKLIPSDFDEVTVQDLVYRPFIEENKANPIFTKQEKLIKDTTSNKNWIQWGDKQFPFTVTFKEGKDGLRKLLTPKMKFTKAEWDKYYQQPISFYIEGQWFKIKTMEDIVIVPHKKNPKSIAVQGDYYQLINQDGNRVVELLRSGQEKDVFFFEKIDVGKDFTFGLVVEILEDNATGFIPERDVHFDLKDDLWGLDSFPPAFQNTKFPKTVSESFLPDFKSNNIEGFRLPNSGSVTYVIDGIRYFYYGKKVNPEEIEKIEAISGTKAQMLYGVDKAILITTKKKTSKTTDNQ